MAEATVLTPGGYRHGSLVHEIGEGQGLHSRDNKMKLKELATETMIDFFQVAIRPEDVPALGGGWITYTYWNNGTGRSISSFGTTWQVPPAPKTQSDQTIFLFNGIQNYGGNYGILQPVLQWGLSGAGGGAYWSVASWYVTSGGQAFHTRLIQVNPGDILTGVMTLTGQTGSSFSYRCEFEGLPDTRLPVQNIAELLWCNETLEAYSIDQRSDYPDIDRTRLNMINIRTGTFAPVLKWTSVDRVNDCGQHGVVVSNSAAGGEVDIYYGA